MKVERLKVVDDGSIQLREQYGSKSCMRCYQRVGSYHSKDCGYQLEAAWKVWAPLVDLREISRDSDRCEARVYILPGRYGRYVHEWIVTGQASLDRKDDRRNEYTFRAYLGRGATDFEHDSAYAVQLPIYGVTFDRVGYHTTVVSGFVSPDLDLDHFRVPEPGYNPFEHPDTHECEDDRCGEAHPIVPEGLYVPKGDPEKLKAVRGRRVEIHFGPARKKPWVMPKDIIRFTDHEGSEFVWDWIRGTWATEEELLIPFFRAVLGWS